MMIKKIFLTGVTVLAISGSIKLAMASQHIAHEVDVESTKEERKFSTIRVISPESSDQVTLTDLQTGTTSNIQPGQDVKVPVGSYQVEVRMEDGYIFNSGEFKTYPTERYDVAVAGYGTMEVTGPAGTVSATKEGGTTITFPIGELKTLPIGNYNVTIQVAGKSSAQTTALVVTNTTSKLRVD